MTIISTLLASTQITPMIVQALQHSNVLAQAALKCAKVYGGMARLYFLRHTFRF